MRCIKSDKIDPGGAYHRDVFSISQKTVVFSVIYVTIIENQLVWGRGAFMTRAKARELAVHLIYERCFTGEDPMQAVRARLDKKYFAMLSEEIDVYADRPNAALKAYINSVVSGVASREEELNEMIQKYSVGWDVSRISNLARSIMQLAIFETLYLDDVPVGVAISEAIRIVKLYDGNETAGFVNGILGAFARELEEKA